MSNDDYNSTENQQSRNLPVQKKGNPTTNEESVEKVPVEKVLSELKKELVLEDKPTEKKSSQNITNLDELKDEFEENQTKEIVKPIEKNQTKNVLKPIEKQPDVINDKPDEELVIEDKEEIIEVPSEEPGKKKFSKKIIKCTTITNPITGEKEVVEELVDEVPFEVKEETEVKEEIVEVPSEEPDRKKFSKRIIKCITKINPITSRKEVVKESVEEVPIAVEEETEVKEEIVEVPSEDPDRNMFIQRIIRYIARTNLTTGEKKFTKRIIRYITRINPNTDEKEVVEELGNETPFEPDDINRMSKKELRNFIREQPLRLIESIRFEAVTRIIPLINQYEERLRTQPRSELKIMFRTIMEFLAKKIILLDRINSDDKEILSECKSLIKYLQSLERRTEEV